MNKRYGRQTVRIDGVSIASEAAIVGEKEGDGPLGEYFATLFWMITNGMKKRGKRPRARCRERR